MKFFVVTSLTWFSNTVANQASGSNMAATCNHEFPTSYVSCSILFQALRSLCSRGLDYLGAYRAFSLKWPAAMLIYWNKRKHLHEKRVQLPEDFVGTPTWPPFHCFGVPIWPPWRHVKTLYNRLPHVMSSLQSCVLHLDEISSMFCVLKLRKKKKESAFSFPILPDVHHLFAPCSLSIFAELLRDGFSNNPLFHCVVAEEINKNDEENDMENGKIEEGISIK